MIICKRSVPLDEDLQEAGLSERQRQKQQWVTGVTRGDGTEEGKGEKRRRKIVADGRDDIEGSIWGPRGPDNTQNVRLQ